MKLRLALLLLALPLPAQADEALQKQVSGVLAQAGPGTRWGFVVADSEGREIVSIDPEGRYIPASNTKMFTTAAAFWKLTGLDQPDIGAATAVYLLPGKGKAEDVVLIGKGDARLSSAPDCKVDCLAPLADAIARKARVVGDVIGDDSIYPDERWSPGMSWNNIPTRSGTGVSALTLDDNEEAITVSPGKDGAPVLSGSGYFRLASGIEVVPPFDEPAPASVESAAAPLPVRRPNRTSLDPWRMPGSRELRITGKLVEPSPPQVVRAGVDDPAERAAWTLAAMLYKRGVRVTGKVRVHHALPQDADAASAAAEAVNAAVLAVNEPVAEAVPAPLGDDLTLINKQSQNLHAELVLRRLGRLEGSGSIADGQKVVTAMLTEAGLKPHQFFFADGSGMSSYNRIAPRGAVAFLRWTRTQPWGDSFRTTLPVGGVDGTLAGRFKGTSLEGKVMAKTGTLNASHALAGFLTARSGKVLVFAAYANDVPEGVAATRFMDQALVAVAEAN